MKEIDTSNLLAQLRINHAKFKQEMAKPAIEVETKSSASFSTLLQQSVDKVNELQQQSGALGTAFELSDPNVSLAEVMIAKQKAGIAFQAVLQVRNKLLSAYKDIMSMPV